MPIEVIIIAVNQTSEPYESITYWRPVHGKKIPTVAKHVCKRGDGSVGRSCLDYIKALHKTRLALTPIRFHIKTKAFGTCDAVTTSIAGSVANKGGVGHFSHSVDQEAENSI